MQLGLNSTHSWLVRRNAGLDFTRESCSWLWNLRIRSFSSSFSSDVMLKPETLPVVSVTTNYSKRFLKELHC